MPTLRRRSTALERACSGEAQVRGVDPQFVHEMEDLDLLSDGGIEDGRGLEAVPERLVVELDGVDGARKVPRRSVPVVDQLLFSKFHLGPRRSYSPRKTGFRFSRKAAVPSFMSRVPQASPNRVASR